jgi:hypothetical protein
MSMTVRFRGWLSACVIFAALAAVCGAGCKSQEDKDAEKRQKRLDRQERRERARTTSSDASGPEQVIGRRDDDRGTSSSDRSSRGLDEVPTTAKRVDVGTGPRLTYSAARGGTVYVYDSDDDRVILATPLRADERFALDPDANRATVDGRTVLGTGLSPRHRYRLYFDSGSR